MCLFGFGDRRDVTKPPLSDDHREPRSFGAEKKTVMAANAVILKETERIHREPDEAQLQIAAKGCWQTDCCPLLSFFFSLLLMGCSFGTRKHVHS